MAAALRAAMKHVAKFGVTSVQDLPGGEADVPAWDALRDAGAMTVRVNYRPSLGDWPKAKELQSSMKNDDWFRIGGVKGFMDGSLGSGTAVMFEDFSDEPGNNGVYAAGAIPLSKIEERIAGADKAGLQVEVHAIGDRANAELLDIYERVEKQNGPRDRRFRDRARPAPARRRHPALRRARRHRLHAAVPRRRRRPLGRRSASGPSGRSTTYAFRSLLDDKATLVFGSDWDVAPISPILGIAAAVTRRTIDGKNPNGWVPEQKITVEEALRAYTVSAAYAGFEEKEKGSLEIGQARRLRHPRRGPVPREARGRSRRSRSTRRSSADEVVYSR